MTSYDIYMYISFFFFAELFLNFQVNWPKMHTFMQAPQELLLHFCVRLTAVEWFVHALQIQ